MIKKIIREIQSCYSFPVHILLDHGCGKNFGDIAMLEAVTRKLCSVFPTATIAIVGHPPVDELLRTEPRIRVTGTQNIDADAHDMLFVCGGGNLTELFAREVHRRCDNMEAFLRKKKAVVLTGQQLGPFQSKDPAERLKHCLRQATFVGVRDIDSLRFCEEAGIPNENFGMTGDDSLGLAPALASNIDAILKENSLERGKFLAINVRLGSYVPEHREHLSLIAHIFDALSEQLSLPMLFVPISLNSFDSDREAATELKTMMLRSFTVLETSNLEASDIKGILGAAYGAVGTSWHFCTFTLSMGKAAVCLYSGEYYGQKGRGLASFWGDERLAIQLPEEKPALVAQSILQTFSNQALQKNVLEKTKQAERIWNTFFEETLPVLTKTHRGEV